MIDKVVKVNLGSEGVVPIIKITIGDDMWRWHFQIYHENARWTIPNDAYIKLSGKKPSGESFELPCTVRSNEVLADCSKTLTDIPGMSSATLKIYDGDEKLVNSCRISIFCASDAPCFGQRYYIPSSSQPSGSTSGGYIKPETGIPMGDLARDVQNAIAQSAAQNIFVAEYGVTTIDEIRQAYEDEKVILVRSGMETYWFTGLFNSYNAITGKNEVGYDFICFDGSLVKRIECTENGWAALPNKEIGSGDLDSKVDIYQGSGNTGKYLAVGADGYVTLVNAPSGQSSTDEGSLDGIIVSDENGNTWVFLEGIGDSGDIAITDDDGNYWHMPSGAGSGNDINVLDNDGHVWHIVAKTANTATVPASDVGAVLMRTRTGAAWTQPASDFSGDNTRPITAAAVYTEIGNINALLATI